MGWNIETINIDAGAENCSKCTYCKFHEEFGDESGFDCCICNHEDDSYHLLKTCPHIIEW